MTNYSLSKPQKALAGCAVLVFVVISMILIAISYWYWQSNLNLPISVHTNTGSMVLADGKLVESGFKYEDVVTQQSGYAVIKWNGATMVVTTGTTFTILPTKVEIVRGNAYLLGSNAELQLGEQVVSLGTAKGLYLGSQQALLIVDGSTVVAGKNVGVNSVIVERGGTLQVNTFDRNQLKLGGWAEVIDVIGSAGYTPEGLADLTPPKITDITPPSDSELTDEVLILSGMVDDPNADVFVNNLEATVNSDGSFRIGLELVDGGNPITLRATDLSGNQTTMQLNYVKVLEPTNSEVVDTSIVQ